MRGEKTSWLPAWFGLLLGLGLLLGVGPANAGELSPELAEKMNRAAPEDFVEAIIYFREQPNVRAELASLGDAARNRGVAHRRVIEHLTGVANRTQGDLLREVGTYTNAGLVTEHRSFWIVNAVYIVGRPEVIRILAARPEVEVADVDPVFFPVASERSGGAPAAPASGVEWGIARIRANELWGLGYRGEGVIVCSIDTGVDVNHPALNHNWRGLSVPGSEAWFDPWHDPRLPAPVDDDDESGHGTHTTGTMCGEDGEDHVGVAPGAQWIAANYFEKVGGQLSGPWDRALECLEWAADPDGDPLTVDDVPHVVNNSWGAKVPSLCDDICDEAIANLEGAGAMVVFSAMNDGPDFQTVTRPASSCLDSTTVFSVGATNSSDEIADFSSRGPSPCDCAGSLDIKPEVSAPGVDVRSAKPGGGYRSMQGTSMAAPHVSGALALLRQMYPEAHPTELKKALMRSAVDLGAVGEDNTYGWGRIDVYEAQFKVMPEASLDTVFVDAANIFGPWDGSAANPFLTIREGLLKAPRLGAHAVSVAAGIYLENQNLTVPPGMSLLGAGAAATIDGGGINDAVTMGGGTKIAGFTIINAGHAGIHATAEAEAWIEISDCIITRPTHMGILASIEGGAHVTVDRCTVQWPGAIGIWFMTPTGETGYGDIGDCVMWGDGGLGSQGIYVYGSESYLVRNTIERSGSAGIYIRNADAVHVLGNLITGCFVGLACDQSSVDEDYNCFWDNGTDLQHCADPGAHTIFCDPFYMDRASQDLRLMAGSPCIDTGYHGAEGRDDIGALEFVPSALVPSPTDVAAEVWGQDGEIRLTWDQVAAATGYVVYYAQGEWGFYNGTDATEGDCPIRVAGAAATSLVLDGLTNGTTYRLDVSAVDAAGLESDLRPLDYATVVPQDTVPPGYPNGLVADAADTSIVLHWSNPSASDWAGTAIYRRNTFPYPDSVGDGTLVYSGTGTTCTDRGLVNGTPYYYTAFAFDEVPNYTGSGCGDGCRASAIPADITPPGNPKFTGAEAGERQVSLSWINPADADWFRTRVLRRTDHYPINYLDGFQVYQGTDTAAVDTGLVNGLTYYYGAFARDEVDVPNWSPAAPEAQVQATPQDLTPPVWRDSTALDSLAADVGQVTLYWNTATDAEHPPVFYNVYYDSLGPEGPDEEWTKLSRVSPQPGAGGWDLSYTVTGLKNGREYIFVVRAEDNAPVPNETAETDLRTVWVEYRTPGTGSRYTLADLVPLSDGGVECGNPFTGSNYTFFGHLTISANDTLDLDAGQALASADSIYRKKLVVLGSLEANGNASSGYVTLTGLGHTPDRRWGGLELTNPGTTSHLDSVVVEKCHQGIRWYGGNPAVTNCIIRDVSQTGLVAQCDTAGSITVEKNSVYGCGGSGVECAVRSGGHASIQENQVSGNSGTGIALNLEPTGQGIIAWNEVWQNGSGIGFAYSNGSLANVLHVENNTVRDNAGDGIGVGKTGSQTVISDNLATGNDIGIDFLVEGWDYPNDPLARDNTVSGNTTAGIRCASLAHPWIDSCLVTTNGGPGILSIQSMAWAPPIVTNTTITGNAVGVRCDTLQGMAGRIDLGNMNDGDPLNNGWNQILGNTSFDVENLTADSIWAQNNWWGFTTMMRMVLADQHCPDGCPNWSGCGTTCGVPAIWDKHDQQSRGIVNFRFYRTISGGGVPPTITITSPDPGGAWADTSFVITWTDSDPEQDAVISLFYEEAPGVNRRPIPGASALSEDDPVNQFAWHTAATDTGSFFIFAAISDGWSADSSSSEGAVTVGHPFIAVDTTALAVTLRPDSTETVPLVLSNVGSYDLSFSLAAEDSNGVDLVWADPEPSSGSISPGGSVVAQISLDAAGLASGLYQGKVRIASSDPWHPELTVGLQLAVRAPDLVLSQSSHDFGSVSLGDTLTWILVGTNAGDDTLHLYSATVVLPDYWLDPPVENWTVVPGASDTLTVRFAPREAGTHPDTLRLATDDPDGGLQAVPLQGAGMRRLVLSTTSLDFGEVALLDSGTASFWAVNGDTASFSIVATELGGPPFSALGPMLPHTLAPGESVTVDLRFAPMAPGPFDDDLVLTTDLGPSEAAHVSLHGEGSTPSLALSTERLQFGTHAVGDTAVAGLWARNIGLGSLVLTGGMLSDPRFTVAAPSFPRAVAASESVQVVVHFVPTAPGAVGAILTLNSNDPFHGAVQVQLSGSGPAPDIHLSQMYVYFGEQIAGVDTAAASLPVVNQGTEVLEVLALSVEGSAFTTLTSVPHSVTPGETLAVSLFFHPASESLYEGTLSIVSSDPDAAEDTARVTLIGEGVIPALALSADSLIAEAFEDGSAQAGLTVRNAGSGTLRFQVNEAGAKVEDLPWLDVSPDSGAVAGGDSLALTANFDPAPVGHGVHHGKLLFTSNDPTGGSREVPVILRVPRMHYADLDTGNVRITVTDEGVFGYRDMGQYQEYGQGAYGSGFHFPSADPENHLFNGSVWLARDSSYVADASCDYDWAATPDGALRLAHEAGVLGARAEMNDANGATPLGLKVRLAASAAPNPPDDDYVLVELTIENPTSATVAGLYAGLWFDWDTGSSHNNAGGYSAAEGLGYLRDPAHPETTVVGLVAIDPVAPSAFRLIHHPTYVYPYGEVRDQDAYAFMASGVVDTVTFQPDDWSMVMATGPFTLAPAEASRFVVAVAAGAGLADLQANAARARLVHSPTVVAAATTTPITRYELGAPRPNPFNPEVSFALEVPDPGGPVSVMVYDVQGRLVRRLHEGWAAPGRRTLTWRGTDEAGRPAASGIYFVRMAAGDVVRTRKAILLK